MTSPNESSGEIAGATPATSARPAAEPPDAAAWAAVLAGWGDDAVHRAHLDGCADLDALARAGARYRTALAARPGDAVAARWRDEIVKRAMVRGFAVLPRTAPRRAVPPWSRRLALAAAGLLVAALVAVTARQLSLFLGARP